MPLTLPDSGTANSAEPALTIVQEGEGDAITARAEQGIASYAAIGGVGVHARSHAGVAVFAESELESAVLGEANADKKAGVFGTNAAFGGIGTVGLAPAKGGVVADGDAAGVQASGGENAIVAEAARGTAVIAVAHQSDDHPQRPSEQFLRHVALESDDRRTIYDGEATLDRAGAATVELPRWFASVNTRPRYQLTALGRPAPDLHVAGDDEKRASFRIAGGAPGQRVCWRVTAVRADAWAKAHPFRVEVDKDRITRGKYLNPVELGAPEQHGLLWPELEAMRKREAERGKPSDADPAHAARPAPTDARTAVPRIERPARPATSDLPEPPDLDRR